VLYINNSNINKNNDDGVDSDAPLHFNCHSSHNINSLKTLILHYSPGARLTMTKWAEQIIKAAGPSLRTLKLLSIPSRTPISAFFIHEHCPKLLSLVLRGKFNFGSVMSAHLIERPCSLVDLEDSSTDISLDEFSSSSRGLRFCELDEKPRKDLARLCPRLRRLVITRSQAIWYTRSSGHDQTVPGVGTGGVGGRRVPTILHQPDSIRDVFLIRLFATHWIYDGLFAPSCSSLQLSKVAGRE
jgi:hypothetical protein